MFEQVFDLPAHVFFVHAPAVLIPMVGAAAVLYAFWSPRSPWFGRGLVGGTLGVTVLTFFAIKSGEEFDKLLNGIAPVEKHERLGNQTMILMVGLFVAVSALAVVRGVSVKRAQQPNTPLSIGLGLVTAALAVLAVIWVIRTGHEGARITWGNVIPQDASP